MLYSTKRHLLTAATAYGVAPARPRARSLPDHEQALYEAARKEGELTWYSGAGMKAIGRDFMLRR